MCQNIRCRLSESARGRKKDIIKGRESILFPDVSMEASVTQNRNRWSNPSCLCKPILKNVKTFLPECWVSPVWECYEEKKDMVKGRESILLPDASMGGKSVWKLLVPKSWLFWPPQTTLFVSRNVRVDKSVIWYALCRDWKYINLYVFIYLFIIIIIIISALFNYHVTKRQITRKRK